MVSSFSDFRASSNYCGHLTNVINFSRSSLVVRNEKICLKIRQITGKREKEGKTYTLTQKQTQTDSLHRQKLILLQVLHSYTIDCFKIFTATRTQFLTTKLTKRKPFTQAYTSLFYLQRGQFDCYRPSLLWDVRGMECIA